MTRNIRVGTIYTDSTISIFLATYTEADISRDRSSPLRPGPGSTDAAEASPIEESSTITLYQGEDAEY